MFVRLAALLAALACVLFAASAQAESALERAAKLDPTFHFGGGGSLTIAPLLEARWTAVETGGDDLRTVTGFSVPRARLVTTTQLFDGFRLRLRIGSGSSGSVSMQQAYAELQTGKFQLRVGQFPLVINAGEEPSAQGLSSADFSSYATTFAGGDTRGIQAAYRGPVRFIATIGNGARTGFAERLSPIVADFAATGRFEVPIGPQAILEYASTASFPKGQPLSARLAAVGHFQARGTTSTHPSNNVEFVGADAGLRGSGFSLLASTTYLRLAQAGLPTVKSAGFWLFGSLFLARKVEVFAQFDAIYPLGERAPFPEGVANGQPGTTLFRTLTYGSNFYLVPDKQMFKIQADLQTMFDGQDTSIVPPNAALGVLASTGLQVSSRVQLVIAL